MPRTIICPECKYPNPDNRTECFHCHVNLEDAITRRRQQSEQIRLQREWEREEQRASQIQEISLQDANIFHGYTGTVVLDENKVIIKRTGFINFWYHGIKGDKEIYIDQISAIQFKNAGTFIDGFIQFSFLGGIENLSSYTDSLHDENTVMFTYEQQSSFLRLKELLDRKINELRRSRDTQTNNTSGITPTEELERLAALLERGLITRDEFDRRKRQILNL